MNVITHQQARRLMNVATAVGLGAGSRAANTMPARPPSIFDNRWRALTSAEFVRLSNNSQWLTGLNGASEVPFFPGSTIRFFSALGTWWCAIFRQSDAKTFYFGHALSSSGLVGTPQAAGTGASLLDRWNPVPTTPPPHGAPPTSPPESDPHWIALATVNIAAITAGAVPGATMRSPTGTWVTWRQGSTWYGERSAGAGARRTHRYYRYEPGASRGPLQGVPEEAPGTGAPRAVTNPSLHRYGGTAPVTPAPSDPNWQPLMPAALARLATQKGWVPAVTTAQQHGHAMFHYHGQWFKMAGGRFWVLGAGSSPRPTNPPAFAGAPGVGDVTLPTTTVTGANQTTLNAAQALVSYFNSNGVPPESTPVGQVLVFQQAYNADASLGGAGSQAPALPDGTTQLQLDSLYGPDTQAALNNVTNNAPAYNPAAAGGGNQPLAAPLPAVPGAQPDYTVPILIGAGVVAAGILTWAFWPKGEAHHETVRIRAARESGNRRRRRARRPATEIDVYAD